MGAERNPDFSDLKIDLAKGAGAVHIGISRAVLIQQTNEIAANVVVLSAAGLLITFEILLLVVAAGITQPLALLGRVVRSATDGDLAVHVVAAGRSDLARLLRLIDVGLEQLRLKRAVPTGRLREVRVPNLVYIRTPLFFFCFAEELIRSFLPLYSHILAEEVAPYPIRLLPHLSNELLVGLPITLFMLVVALFTPLAATYSDRVGRRKSFLLGALLSAVGLISSAAPIGYWGMLLFRGVSGVGYAAVFMACQGYVLDNTSARDRSQGLSIYVGAIAAADLCGPPHWGEYSPIKSASAFAFWLPLDWYALPGCWRGDWCAIMTMRGPPVPSFGGKI